MWSHDIQTHIDMHIDKEINIEMIIAKTYLTIQIHIHTKNILFLNMHRDLNIHITISITCLHVRNLSQHPKLAVTTPVRTQVENLQRDRDTDVDADKNKHKHTHKTKKRKTQIEAT